MNKKGISDEGVIIIALMILTIIVAIAINKGILDEPDVKISGYLFQSDRLEKHDTEFGYQFRNDGKKDGLITIKVSSEDKNITFVEDEIKRTIPITKDSYMLVDVVFEINKSSFEDIEGNFSIFFDIEGLSSKIPRKFSYQKVCQRDTCYFDKI